MAVDKRSNKNASTEDALGLIHTGITNVMQQQMNQMLLNIEAGMDVDLAVDGRQLEAMMKWVSDRNGITCAAPEADAESALSKQLSAIKAKQKAKLEKAGNVVSFDDSATG